MQRRVFLHAKMKHYQTRVNSYLLVVRLSGKSVVVTHVKNYQKIIANSFSVNISFYCRRENYKLVCDDSNERETGNKAHKIFT